MENPTFVPDTEETTSNTSKNSPPDDSIAVPIENATKPPTEGILTDPYERRRHVFYIWKNVVLTGLGVLGVMTAYDTLLYVESSIHSKEGLGFATLTSIYSTLVICSLLAPSLFIIKLGCKWTFVLSIVCFAIYSAAHFYASFYILIPGAVAVGIGMSLMRTSTNSLMTELALSYSSALGIEKTAAINSLFGVFIMITFTPRIWGNLISFFILHPGDNEVDIDESRLPFCGANYCHGHFKTSAFLPSNQTESWSNTSLAKPHSEDLITEKQRTNLFAIASGIAVATAVLIAFILDGRKEEKKAEDDEEQPGILQHIAATFRQMKDIRQLLLIFIILNLGFLEAYMSGSFTKGFVSCSLGVHWVGLIIICYGVTAALSSYLSGRLAILTSQTLVILLTALVNLSGILAMLFWSPDPDNKISFYILAGVMGIADGGWRSQLYAYSGSIFTKTKEAAFANFEVWQSIGYVLGYAMGSVTCIWMILYMHLAFLAMGILGFLGIQLKESSTVKKIWKCLEKHL